MTPLDRVREAASREAKDSSLGPGCNQVCSRLGQAGTPQFRVLLPSGATAVKTGSLGAPLARPPGSAPLWAARGAWAAPRVSCLWSSSCRRRSARWQQVRSPLGLPTLRTSMHPLWPCAEAHSSPRLLLSRGLRVWFKSGLTEPPKTPTLSRHHFRFLFEPRCVLALPVLSNSAPRENPPRS